MNAKIINNPYSNIVFNVHNAFDTLKILKYFIKKRFSHNSKDKFEEDQVIKKTYCIFDYANRLPIKN